MVGPVPLCKESSVLRASVRKSPRRDFRFAPGARAWLRAGWQPSPGISKRTRHMHINHIDIPVPDIAATRDFFQGNQASPWPLKLLSFS